MLLEKACDLEGVGADAVHAHRERLDALQDQEAVSYTHLRAHETVLDLVCRLLLEKKKTSKLCTNWTLITAQS